MVWYEKIQEIVESAESIELRVYRNKVRDELFTELTRMREEMRSQGKYPYGGNWLTQDEIILAWELEKKGKFSRFILVILIYLFILLGSGFLVMQLWRLAS